MSAETYAALEDAIRAHVGDNSPDSAILTDWYLMTAVSPEVGLTEYLHICSDMPMHTAIGLVSIALRRLTIDNSRED